VQSSVSSDEAQFGPVAGHLPWSERARTEERVLLWRSRSRGRWEMQWSEIGCVGRFAMQPLKLNKKTVSSWLPIWSSFTPLRSVAP